MARRNCDERPATTDTPKTGQTITAVHKKGLWHVTALKPFTIHSSTDLAKRLDPEQDIQSTAHGPRSREPSRGPRHAKVDRVGRGQEVQVVERPKESHDQVACGEQRLRVT